MIGGERLQPVETATTVPASSASSAASTSPTTSSGEAFTAAAGGLLYARMPGDGHYFWNVFPGLLTSGVGLAFTFVPVMIASLTGVQPADAGVASGLINTSRQIGGSIGLAALTTIAATASSNYASSHAVPASSAPALTHGFQVGFYTLIGVALVGAAIAAALVESKPKAAPTVERVEAELALEDAA